MPKCQNEKNAKCQKCQKWENTDKPTHLNGNLPTRTKNSYSPSKEEKEDTGITVLFIVFQNPSSPHTHTQFYL
jgi:hypothetical protein